MNDLTTEENAPERPSTPDGSRKQFRPLRVWPAFLLALLMLVTRFAPGISEEGAAKYWMVAVFRPAVELPPFAYLVACGQPGDLAGNIVRFSGPGRERRAHHYARSPDHARSGDDVSHPPDGLLPFRAHRRTSQEIAARDSFGDRGAALARRTVGRWAFPH